jgi:hypothetical protein
MNDRKDAFKTRDVSVSPIIKHTFPKFIHNGTRRVHCNIVTDVSGRFAASICKVVQEVEYCKKR